MPLASPALAADTRASDEVVVEGERDDPGRTSSSVTVVPVDDRLPASADLASVVDAVPGAAVRRLGGLGDFAGVSIRGSTFRQVQVSIDGIPLNPDGIDAVDLSELPLRAFGRVEIYRGNAPASLAGAPIGGVVNLVTSDAPPPTLTATGGSNGTMGLAATAGGSDVDSDLLAHVAVLHTDGDFVYFDDNATIYDVRDDAWRRRQNNATTRIDAHARWRTHLGPVRLTVLDAAFARRRGLAGHTNARTRSTSLDTSRNLAVIAAEVPVGPVTWTTRLWNQARWERYDDRLDEIGVGAQHLRQRTTTTGMLSTATWGHRVVAPTVTVSARHEAFSDEDLIRGTPGVPWSRVAVTAAAAADLWLLGDRLRATPVVHVTALPDLISADPRLGVVVRPVDWLALKGNGGTYLRPPDPTELHGDRGAVVGNPLLRPERGWQLDASATADLRTASVTATATLGGFAGAARDRVVLLQNAQRVMVPANLGRSTTAGVEAGATLAVAGRWDLQASLTRTVAINRTDDDAVLGNQLPGVPGWEASARTSLTFGDHVRIGTTWSFVDATWWDATNWFRAPPRSIHGAFLRLAPHRRGPELEVDVLNLSNRTTQVVDRNPLDPGDDVRITQSVTDWVGYPLPGRTVLVSIRYALGG